MSDSYGNWPQWIEDATDWISEKYEYWKEESFLYNVILTNVTTSMGIGIGMGAEVDIGLAKISAISRVDVSGVETFGLEALWGHHGKSSISAEIGNLYAGVESKTYESFDGKHYNWVKGKPDVGYSLGGEFGFVIAVHASFSVSFAGIYDSFITFGSERGWWK